MGLTIRGLEVTEIRRNPRGGRIVTVRLPEQPVERREREDQGIIRVDQSRIRPGRDFSRLTERPTGKDEIPEDIVRREQEPKAGLLDVRDKMNVIVRVEKETGYAPSGTLISEILRWSDFKEEKIREWFLRRKAEEAASERASAPAAKATEVKPKTTHKARPERAEPYWEGGEPEQLRRRRVIRNLEKELEISPSPREFNEMFLEPDFSDEWARKYLTRVKAEQDALLQKGPGKPATPRHGWTRPTPLKPVPAPTSTEEQLLKAAFGEAEVVEKPEEELLRDLGSGEPAAPAQEETVGLGVAEQSAAANSPALGPAEEEVHIDSSGDVHPLEQEAPGEESGLGTIADRLPPAILERVNGEASTASSFHEELTGHLNGARAEEPNADAESDLEVIENPAETPRNGNDSALLLSTVFRKAGAMDATGLARLAAEKIETCQQLRSMNRKRLTEILSDYTPGRIDEILKQAKRACERFHQQQMES